MRHRIVLTVGRDQLVLGTCNAILQHAGYEVLSTSVDRIACTLASRAEVAVLSNTIPVKQRMALVLALKQDFPSLPVVIMHSDDIGYRCPADAAVHSLDGPDELLSAIASVLPVEGAAAANAMAG